MTLTKTTWMSMTMDSHKSHDGVLLMMALKAMTTTLSLSVETPINKVYPCVCVVPLLFAIPVRIGL